MSLLLLLLPQLLRWQQEQQLASKEVSMAGKAPGPRRLDEEDPQELDDIPLVMPDDVVGGCLRVLPTMFLMTMSKDLSKVRLAIDAGLQDALHISVMYSSKSRMPSEKMKMDSRCGGMESSAGRPRTDEPALLPCEIKMGSSEFLRGEFQSWIPQKSLESCQSMVRHWWPLSGYHGRRCHVDVVP